jgi:hypothetical protein
MFCRNAVISGLTQGWPLVGRGFCIGTYQTYLKGRKQWVTCRQPNGISGDDAGPNWLDDINSLPGEYTTWKHQFHHFVTISLHMVTHQYPTTFLIPYFGDKWWAWNIVVFRSRHLPLASSRASILNIQVLGQICVSGLTA